MADEGSGEGEGQMGAEAIAMPDSEENNNDAQTATELTNLE